MSAVARRITSIIFRSLPACPILAALACLAGAPGCASYWRDRGKDLAEIGGIRGTLGVGFALNVRATAAARAGGAVYREVSSIGFPAQPDSERFRGAGAGLAAAGIGAHTTTLWDIETGESAGGSTVWGFEWLPEKGRLAHTVPVAVTRGPAGDGETPVRPTYEEGLGLPEPFAVLPWSRERRFFDTGVGFHAGIAGFEIFLNPYQLIDFTIGWIGLDLDGDDTTGWVF